MDDNQPIASVVRPRPLLAVLTLATAIVNSLLYAAVLSADGLGFLDFAQIAVFLLLSVWVAFAFWTATIGFIRRLRGAGRVCALNEGQGDGVAPLRRTAILMPVYNEEPRRVFAGLQAIYESLQATGHGSAFDFFVLSDTTSPDVWLDEELGWVRMKRSVAGESKVYYRRRPTNEGRKAGNIADFCRQWGPRYPYMVVLDADSLMAGETLVEMSRRMDRDPQMGILQAPPTPINRVSLFARCQQFASHVYGPNILEGVAWWSQTDGNYWGHNAIIRTAAFTDHCGLSRLPGSGPLGGEILSHDFVEAALMRRAGWKVCLAHDLPHSYEESPPTLVDYAKRDQRWCQGNMQHLRLIVSSGMHPVSRLHMGMGAMSYLSSPIWLVFLILTFLATCFGTTFTNPLLASTALPGTSNWPMFLFTGNMAMLLLPKLWGYLSLLKDRPRLQRCGGAARAAVSVLLELFVSIAVAPILMAFHAMFVANTFLGRKVEWTTQARDEGGQPLRVAIAAHWRQTLFGMLAAALCWLWTPALFLWLSPVWLGLVLSVPLSMLLSSVRVGQALADWGLLLVPEETDVPTVIRRARQLLADSPREAPPRFESIVLDPVFVLLHRSILLATGAHRSVPPELRQRIDKRLRSGKLAGISEESRRAILSDGVVLQELHLRLFAAVRSSDVLSPFAVRPSG